VHGAYEKDEKGVIIMKKMIGMLSTLAMMFAVVVVGALSFDSNAKSHAGDTNDQVCETDRGGVAGVVTGTTGDTSGDEVGCDMEFNVTVDDSISLRLSTGANTSSSVETNEIPGFLKANRLKVDFGVPTPLNEYTKFTQDDIVATVNMNNADGYDLNLQGKALGASLATDVGGSSISDGTELADTTPLPAGLCIYEDNGEDPGEVLDTAVGRCIKPYNGQYSADSDIVDLNDMPSVGAPYFAYATNKDANPSLEVGTEVKLAAIPDVATSVRSNTSGAAVNEKSYFKFVVQTNGGVQKGTFKGGASFTAVSKAA
jgi:hypothetical protein